MIEKVNKINFKTKIMVDIQPGEGLFFAQGTKQIRLGDSLNRVISLVQDSLSVFGTIKIIVPPTDRPENNDIWVFLVQSGLKLKFDGLTQELCLIEIFLTSSKPFAKRVSWYVKGSSLTGASLSLEGIEQIMY